MQEKDEIVRKKKDSREEDEEDEDEEMTHWVLPLPSPVKTEADQPVEEKGAGRDSEGELKEDVTAGKLYNEEEHE